MNRFLIQTLMTVAAYLVGSIPFAYLVYRARAGGDIRAFGSGNVGATNIGRLLGFRFFLLVFALDLLKGALPTFALPRLVSALSGPYGPIVVGAATILGHVFPVFLGFRGGKGVATSLGVVLAIEPIPSLVALAVFGLTLIAGRMVSVSSTLGALAFTVAYFVRQPDPFGRGLPMTILTCALLTMLVARHRKNFARVLAGTEPRVSFSKRQGNAGDRRGSARIALVIGLAAIVGAGALLLVKRARRPVEFDLQVIRLRETGRYATGHQRTTRLAFSDDGRALAAICPRYERLVLLRVTVDFGLDLIRDVPLDGRPVAVAATAGGFLVLQRPASDERHVEPGWYDRIDLAGERVGDRAYVGINPYDLAAIDDGRTVLVLASDRSTADGRLPERFLRVDDVSSAAPATLARLTIERPEDTDARFSVSATGEAAVIALPGSGRALAIDLADRARPSIVGEWPLPEAVEPYPSADGGDRILMPTADAAEAVLLDHSGDSGAFPGCVVLSAGRGPERLVAGAFADGTRRPLGSIRLPVLLHLGEIRPSGLAWNARRQLIAVAGRSGSVHLLAAEWVAEPSSPTATAAGYGPAEGSSGRSRMLRNSAPLP